MLGFLSRLLDTSGFPPRWHCGVWTPAHGWLHILSDLGVWSAYVAIPCVLGYFALRRKDIPFRTIFWLFGAFILACGTTHLMEAIIFWWPAYRLAGAIKLFTALVSWGTVLALVPVTPQALAMRSPDELEREITARRDAENALKQVNAELEHQLAALRASEERFRLLVDGTRDHAIFMLDPSGRVVSWNPGAERIKGYSAEEIIGQHFARFYTPEDVQACRPERELAAAAADGVYKEEGWRLRKDGSRFWANVVVTAMRDEQENVRGFSKITRDMTERKEAEENARRLLEEAAARRAAEASASLLFEQREQLRVTLHSIGDGVIATDAEGRVTLLNPVAEALTGWTNSEAVGQPLPRIFAILNETTRQEVENPVTKVLSQGTVVGLANHTVLIAKTGEERPIDDSAAPIKDDKGRILGVVLVFRDATKQRTIERRRAARLAVTESLAEANHLAEIAPRILRALCENLDWSAGGIWLGDPQGQEMRCLDVWYAPSHPAGTFTAASREFRFQRGVGLPGRIWASGEPAWIPDVGQDTNFPRAAIAAASNLHAAFGFPITAGRQVLGAIEFFHDEVRAPDSELLEMAATIGTLIGEFLNTKKAGERLRLLWESAAVILASAEPEAMLRELFANIGPHFGLDVYVNYIVDETGDALRLVSSMGIPDQEACRISRLEFGQAICGRVALDRQAIVATHIQQSDDPNAQLVKALGVRAYECNPLLVDQELLGTLSFGSRSRDEFDRDELEILQTISQYVAVAYERLRLVGRLRDADRRKDEFLATLAHELRNPLAPIRNAVEILRRADGDAPLLEDARRMMERQLDLMTRLIDDLLDVSRISRGKVQLRKERVELANLIRSALETVRPLIDSQGHDLAITLPPQPIVVDADPTRLAQVIANLLNNAAKYTEKGGRIWLTAERQDGEVVMSIRDTGIGIAPEHLPHLFEMFSQAAPALERSQGGLGIGLSLVRGLVELHGGTVQAHSDGIGRGSRFVVRLPIVDPHIPHTPAEPAVENQVPATGKRRILVVDDHRDAAESLARLLRLMGHETCTAHDGLEAAQAAASYRPEVILLDIGLPRINGYEVARQIRQQPWGQGMILIALTGWGQDEDKRRAWDAGFDHHMTKPVEPTALEKLLALISPQSPR
jgi:PAS domain S-box-containing protein